MSETQDTQKNNEFEKIELTLPVNSAYVSSARLTASSISNRMGFSIDDIEDIKSSVSEACVFVITQCIKFGSSSFHLEFLIEDNEISINLKSDVKKIVDNIEIDKDDMSIKVIQTLMDSINIEFDKSSFEICMKKHK